MKKAKIALTAIAIIAVIGGAFAFKATRTSHLFFKTGVGTTLCNVGFQTLYTTTSDPEIAVDDDTFRIPYTTIANQPCGITAYQAL